MSLRLDDINQKENSIKLSLQTVDYRLAKLEDLALQTADALYSIQHMLTTKSLQHHPTTTSDSAAQTAAGPILGTTPTMDWMTVSGLFPTKRHLNESRLRPFTDYTCNTFRRPPFSRAITVAAPGSLSKELPVVHAAMAVSSGASVFTHTSPMMEKQESLTQQPYLGSSLYQRRRKRPLVKLRSQLNSEPGSPDSSRKVAKGMNLKVTFSDEVDIDDPLGDQLAGLSPVSSLASIPSVREKRKPAKVKTATSAVSCGSSQTPATYITASLATSTVTWSTAQPPTLAHSPHWTFLLPAAECPVPCQQALPHNIAHHTHYHTLAHGLHEHYRRH